MNCVTRVCDRENFRMEWNQIIGTGVVHKKCLSVILLVSVVSLVNGATEPLVPGQAPGPPEIRDGAPSCNSENNYCLFPDYDDPNMFYSCVGTESIARGHKCLPGLYFNFAKQVCDTEARWVPPPGPPARCEDIGKTETTLPPPSTTTSGISSTTSEGITTITQQSTTISLESTTIPEQTTTTVSTIVTTVPTQPSTVPTQPSTAPTASTTTQAPTTITQTSEEPGSTVSSTNAESTTSTQTTTSSPATTTSTTVSVPTAPTAPQTIPTVSPWNNPHLTPPHKVDHCFILFNYQ